MDRDDFIEKISKKFKSDNDVDKLFECIIKYIEDNKLSFYMINQLFCDILGGDGDNEIQFPIKLFKKMVDYEIDMYFNNGEIFDIISSYDDPDVFLYFINELGVDINKHKYDIALNLNVRTAKIVFDRGLIFERKLLKLISFDIEMVKLFFNCGYCINDLMYVFVKQIHLQYKPMNQDIINIFIKELNNCKCDIHILNDFVLKAYETYDLSLDTIRTFIDVGINPRHKNDALFIKACMYGDISTIMYFINDCGVDINTCESNALSSAIWNGHYEISKTLIDLNIKITDQNIVLSFIDTKYIDLFVDKSVDIGRISKIFCDSIFTINDKKIMDTIFEICSQRYYSMSDNMDSLMFSKNPNFKREYAKKLRDYGVDFNEFIN